MAPDASSRGVGRRRLGPLLGLHASRRVGDEATAKRPSTPGRCSAAGDKPAGLSWPWSSGGDRFSAASSRSSRARLGLVVGRVSSRTIRSPCPNRRFRTRLSSCGPMRGRLASNRTGPASRGTSCTRGKESNGTRTGGRKRILFNSRPRAPCGLWRPRQFNPVNPCPRGLLGVA